MLHFPRVSCDTADTFTTLWKKLFRDLTITETRKSVGFFGDVETKKLLVDGLPETLTPDDVRRTLRELSRGIILVPIFDEFDRIERKVTTTLMADTIKGLSDHGVDATIIIIGVADSVDELIEEHHSVERTLVQIPMPRMSGGEVKGIVENGMKRLKMKIGNNEKTTIVNLAQGLPYVAHLVSLHGTKSAIERKSKTVQHQDLRRGMQTSLESWQQSIKTTYYKGTTSQQPSNLFAQVVLACAFAQTDEFGYFSATNIRDALRLIISERSYKVPRFARHLAQLSGPERGNLLDRTGPKRKVRYRFNNPLMRPYIIMRGFHEGALRGELLSKLTGDASKDGTIVGLLDRAK